MGARRTGRTQYKTVGPDFLLRRCGPVSGHAVVQQRMVVVITPAEPADHLERLTRGGSLSAEAGAAAPEWGPPAVRDQCHLACPRPLHLDGDVRSGRQGPRYGCMKHAHMLTKATDQREI